MECKYCNAETEENAKFCAKCGKSQVDETDTVNETAVKEESKTETIKTAEPEIKEKKKKVSKVCLLEVLVGIVFVVVGIIGISYSGVSVSSTSFGADFYTYCYRGIVNCVNVLSDINSSFGWLIMASGFGFVFNGLKGLKK